MANVITIILIVCSVISGIGLGIIAGQESFIAGFVTFLIIAGIGSVFAWLLNLLLAGFGELVSNSHEILEIMNDKTQSKVDSKIAITNDGRPNTIDAIRTGVSKTEKSEVKTAELEQKYQRISSKFDDVKTHGKSDEVNALVTELEELGVYKNSRLMLQELSPPIKGVGIPGSEICCPLCQEKQASENKHCHKCGLKFFAESGGGQTTRKECKSCQSLFDKNLDICPKCGHRSQ